MVFYPAWLDTHRCADEYCLFYRDCQQKVFIPVSGFWLPKGGWVLGKAANFQNLGRKTCFQKNVQTITDDKKVVSYQS